MTEEQELLIEEQRKEITKLQKDLEKTVKCLERIDKVYFDDGEARACLEELRGE